MDIIKKYWQPAVIVLLLGSAVGAGALYYNLDQGYSELESREAQRSAALEDAESKISQLEAKLKEAATTDVEVPESSPAESGPELPVIIYSPQGRISDAEENELKTKLVNPFTDYHADRERQLVSVHVEKPTSDSGSSEYEVFAIFADGVNNGFLYGDTTKSTQPWWKPTCLGGCSFKDEFEEKYPEVVE